MTTAREIVTGSLTFGLNRLSPGEAIEADVGAVCLSALNDIADMMSGSGGLLFAETLTESPALTSSTASIATQWGLAPGVTILGATVKLANSTLEYPIAIVPLAEYQAIGIKTVGGTPDRIAFDGLSVVYIYPVPSGEKITLRTGRPVSSFASLDADYSMPPGSRSALSDMLSEKLAPTMLGGITAPIAAAAASARSRLAARSIQPAILGSNGTGRLAAFMRGD